MAFHPQSVDRFDEDVAWVITHGIPQPLAAGHRLVCEGETADAVFVVLEGSFVVSCESLGIGLLARLGPGEIVGEPFPDPAVPPLGTVRAETDAAVLEIPRALLDARLRRDRGFGARFVRLVSALTAERVRELRSRHAERERALLPAREAESLRVHELIERLLRGDLL